MFCVAGMPRKKSKPKLDVMPERPLRNISNQVDSHFDKCVVKMHKIDIGTVDSKFSNEMKRRVQGMDRENNGDISLPKRSARTRATTSVSSCPEPTTAQAPVEQVTSPPMSETDPGVAKLLKRYELLQFAISEKYMNHVERLRLDYVPYCAENPDQCLRKHLKNHTPPPIASATQTNLIRNSMQQLRYKVFINLVSNLCQRGEFPGDIVLTNIVKLILTLNPESKHNTFLQDILDQLVWLFDIILRTFPPCRVALRPYFTKFFRNSVEMTNIFPDKPFEAKNTIFEIVIMLLEDTIDDRESAQNSRGSRRNKDSSILTHFDDEYHNMQHWEKNDNDEQSFAALSRATRLDRLMQVMHFIAKMLEMDLAMWLFRYHKCPSKFIYGDAQPLVVTLFALSSYTRSPVLVKKVMNLFTLFVEKNLDEHYLKIMERYISMLAHVQNICEMECTPTGIEYPSVGAATSSFTLELFKTAQANMKKNVVTYMRLINSLRCPFVIFEFIDLFLNRLNPAPGKMCPEKIVENFRKNRFLECEPDSERQSNHESSRSTSSIIYRSDYLRLLLYALRSYCEFHGTKELFHIVMSKSQEKPVVKTEPTTKGLPPTVICEFNLARMKKKIAKYEAKADMSLVWRTTCTTFPPVNIRVNAKLFAKYRDDIKQTVILHLYLTALKREMDDDFSELLEYLNDFASVI